MYVKKIYSLIEQSFIFIFIFFVFVVVVVVYILKKKKKKINSTSCWCLVSEMGLLGDSQEGGKGKGSSWGGGGVISSLIRRKQVDSVHAKSSGHQLAKALSVPHLIAIGTSFSF